MAFIGVPILAHCVALFSGLCVAIIAYILEGLSLGKETQGLPLAARDSVAARAPGTAGVDLRVATGWPRFLHDGQRNACRIIPLGRDSYR